jgi:hypothetical protein
VRHGGIGAVVHPMPTIGTWSRLRSDAGYARGRALQGEIPITPRPTEAGGSPLAARLRQGSASMPAPLVTAKETAGARLPAVRRGHRSRRDRQFNRADGADLGAVAPIPEWSAGRSGLRSKIAPSSMRETGAASRLFCSRSQSRCPASYCRVSPADRRRPGKRPEPAGCMPISGLRRGPYRGLPARPW